MSYESVIARIESARDVPAKAESYERFRRALAAAEIPLPGAGRGVILVGGTNGKGTVAKTLETILQASLGANGLGVGLYTSPHLMDTTERIRSFGRDLTHEEFVRAFELLEPVVSAHALSHFEILTLMAAEIFFGGRVRKPVTLAVLEVGVGGRLDPTRAIPHETSVITRLGLDHVELLGSSLEMIAREKFAIVDPGNLCVHAPLEFAAASEAARAACLGVAARQVIAKPYAFRVELGEKGGVREPVWIIETPWGDARLGLRVSRAVANVTLALTVLKEFGFDVASSLHLLEGLRWPGRMERLTVDGHAVFLSGDHNPQGVESLAEILAHFEYEKLHLVVGIGKNKDRDEMLVRFEKLPRAVLTLTSTPFRGGDFELYGEWRQRATHAIPDPATALKAALASAGPRDLVLVSGSLYLVGDLRKQIFQGQFGPAISE